MVEQKEGALDKPNARSVEDRCNVCESQVSADCKCQFDRGIRRACHRMAPPDSRDGQRMKVLANPVTNEEYVYEIKT